MILLDFRNNKKTVELTSIEYILCKESFQQFAILVYCESPKACFYWSEKEFWTTYRTNAQNCLSSAVNNIEAKLNFILLKNSSMQFTIFTRHVINSWKKSFFVLREKLAAQ